MKPTDKHITIYSPYRSAHLWQMTGTRPVLEYDEVKRVVVFQFPNSPEIQHALDEHMRGGGSPNVSDFVDRYKLLRAELFLLKGDQR